MYIIFYIYIYFFLLTSEFNNEKRKKPVCFENNIEWGPGERELLRKREEIRLYGREYDEDNKSIDLLSSSNSFSNMNFLTSSKHARFNTSLLTPSLSPSSPSSSSPSQHAMWTTPPELITPFLPPYFRYLQKRREYLLQETHRNLGFYYLDIFIYTPAFYHFLLSNFDPFFALCFSPLITQKSTFLILHQLHYQVCL
jgi:hypothetical protein